MIETYNYDDGGVKISSPWGVWGLMQKLFNFGVEYIFYDVYYDYLWFWLWLFLTWIIIFGVDYDYFYVNYDDICRYLCLWDVNIVPNSSGNDITNRKQTVWSWQKVNILKVRLSGGVWFDKIWVTMAHHLFQATRRRLKGGGGGNVN